ncbi:hypothetical protein [Thauera humireducens]|uniref:hypothetical protein n=1 Tax=Thauera humireducens TaxID=1134435 RepID=UPI00311E8A53
MHPTYTGLALGILAWKIEDARDRRWRRPRYGVQFPSNSVSETLCVSFDLPAGTGTGRPAAYPRTRHHPQPGRRRGETVRRRRGSSPAAGGMSLCAGLLALSSGTRVALDPARPGTPPPSTTASCARQIADGAAS